MAALGRLQQRIKENFQESTRDLSLLTGASSSTASTSYFDSALSEDKLKEISKLLESRSERDRLEGMKRVVAGMSRGRGQAGGVDMEGLFAKVVKNVVAQSIEIRKLVYIYLLRFASTNSDLLLLSINTFQKDLSDPSPLIRSMSLRVLTSIRVPVIQGIVMLGLKKLVNDRNPYVRKTVAGGLSKVYEMDPSSLSTLIPLLQTLLSSPSPLTLGPSLTALLEICPDQLDLLHPFFRHICRLLVDADEWGQVVALHVLTRYARLYLEEPSQLAQEQRQPTEKGEIDDDDDFAGLEDDLAMLLHCAKPLFQSRNAAVVLAACKLYHHLAPASNKLVGREELVRPLLKLAGGAEGEEVRTTSWEVVREMVEAEPRLFKGYHDRLFLLASDPTAVQRTKLEAMTRLVDEENAKASMREFKHYARLPDTGIACAAVRAIGHCVRSQPSVAASGLRTLMKLLKSRQDALVGESVLVLQSIILSLPSTSLSATSPTLADPQRLVARLAKQLDGITSAKARASVFWLVGQFAAAREGEEGKDVPLGLGWEGVVSWAPDVLRKGVKGFMHESTPGKLQVLTLATKLLVLSPFTSHLRLICKYVFGLARYDADYDVRDRGRFMWALVRGVRAESQKQSNRDGMNGEKAEGETGSGDEEAEEEDDLGGVVLRREQIKLVLLGQRAVHAPDSEPASSSNLEPATISRLLGRRLPDYAPLPPWTDDPTDPSLRDSPLDDPQLSSAPAPVQAISSVSFATPPSTAIPAVAPPGPSASSSFVRAADPSPVGSAPMKSKFQDLDKFLDSESEEEEETTDDESDGALPQAPTAVSAPPRKDIVPVYDEDEDEDTDSDEESEDETEDEQEDAPLYKNHFQ